MDIITQSVSFSVCRNNLTVERRQSFIDIDGKIEAAMVGIKLDFHKLPTMIYTLHREKEGCTQREKMI